QRRRHPLAEQRARETPEDRADPPGGAARDEDDHKHGEDRSTADRGRRCPRDEQQHDARQSNDPDQNVDETEQQLAVCTPGEWLPEDRGDYSATPSAYPP